MKKQQTVANKLPLQVVCYFFVFFPKIAFLHYILWFIANNLHKYGILFFLRRIQDNSLVRTRSRVQIPLTAPAKNHKILWFFFVFWDINHNEGKQEKQQQTFSAFSRLLLIFGPKWGIIILGAGVGSPGAYRSSNISTAFC